MSSRPAAIAQIVVTLSQEALATVIVPILANMSAHSESGAASGVGTPTPADPGDAVAWLCDNVPEVRGAALLDGGGDVLAATGEAGRWAGPVAALLEGAEEPGRPEPEQVHVGTEDGEVIAVREAGFVMVAVTDRFPLASLVAFDMRRLIGGLASTGVEVGG